MAIAAARRAMEARMRADVENMLKETAISLGDEALGARSGLRPDRRPGSFLRSTGNPKVRFPHPRHPSKDSAPMSADSSAFASGSPSAYPINTPMRRTGPLCCARAANGHAAAPLTSEMKSRRRITR
jgi:hypothetical protein